MNSATNRCGYRRSPPPKRWLSALGGCSGGGGGWGQRTQSASWESLMVWLGFAYTTLLVWTYIYVDMWHTLICSMHLYVVHIDR